MMRPCATELKYRPVRQGSGWRAWSTQAVRQPRRLGTFAEHGTACSIIPASAVAIPHDAGAQTDNARPPSERDEHMAISGSIRLGRLPRQVPGMRRTRGFTLIEIAVALTIIALLSVGAIGVLQMSMLRTRIAETKAALDEAREAVTAYAVANRSLPCPAISASDGNEQSRAGGSCANRRGVLPWTTLGVRGLDGWGNRLGYVVSPGLVKSPSGRIALSDTGSIDIYIRDGSGAPVTIVTSTAVAFALWSHGENGRGASTSIGTLIDDDSATNIDEDANSSQAGSSPTVFARDGSNNTDAAGGEFDDLVTWESRYVLFGRMINSGQLP